MFAVLVIVGCFSAGFPWNLNHGALLAGAGLLMVWFPPVVRLARGWWLAAGLVVLLGCSSFLPESAGSFPAWRSGLESLGLDTGGQHVVQVRMAVENLTLYGLALLVGLWLAGQRASGKDLAGIVLGFSGLVAVYALASRWLEPAMGGDGHFGYFPNRNHSATLLAMGGITGIASLVQNIRAKRPVFIGLSAVAALVCVWAALQWSISRAGVLLLLIAICGWLPMLGRGYLGRHASKAIGLFILAVAGFFLLVDNPLKDRVSTTIDRVSQVAVAGDEVSPDADAADADAETMVDVDYRIPTWLDTLGMIADDPLQGVGSGQFPAVFPQYRHLTASHISHDSAHPESDWLWCASALGVLAALLVAGLVVGAAVASFRSGRRYPSRALRTGCLVAALVLAVHGIVDVPGHRVPLFWAAALCFSLSLQDSGRSVRAVGGWRLLGVPVLAAGVFLWMCDPGSLATMAPAVARHKALGLEQRDRELAREAAEAGVEYQPAPGEDLLEQALDVLGEAAEKAPLNRDLPYLRGMLALRFDDKEAQVVRDFAVQRALDPLWVEAPVQQALAWPPERAERRSALAEEAIQRARRIDLISPGSRWSERKTRQRLEYLKVKEDLLIEPSGEK
ncbi:MAG: O-antigen ligase family protein [Verrucomicrobiales bacterium]